MSEKGICHLSQIPLRGEPKSSAEMVTQMIYGECYQVIAREKDWLKVKMDYDAYEGWLSKSSFKAGTAPERIKIQQELFAVHPQGEQFVISSMGSELNADLLEYEEESTRDIRNLAMRFLGVPYLWGGRTFNGVDCSGLVQIVFKCLSCVLPRDASQQVKEGKAITFDEITEGDLVFFESDFKVTHVGIALNHSKIIHAHGSVRVDDLTKKGIINAERGELSHHYHSARRVR